MRSAMKRASALALHTVLVIGLLASFLVTETYASEEPKTMTETTIETGKLPTFGTNSHCSGIAVRVNDLKLTKEFGVELRRRAVRAFTRGTRTAAGENFRNIMITKAMSVVCDSGRLQGVARASCLSGFSGQPRIVATAYVNREWNKETGDFEYRAKVYGRQGHQTSPAFVNLHTELGQNGVQCWFQESKFARYTHGLAIQDDAMFKKLSDGSFAPIEKELIGAFRVGFKSPRRSKVYGVTVRDRSTLSPLQRKMHSFGGPTTQYFVGKSLATVDAEVKCFRHEKELARDSEPIPGEADTELLKTRPWVKASKHVMPMILAHRGQHSYTSAENSVAQVKKTLADPHVDGIELDVFLASTGSNDEKKTYEPIVSHDNNLMRLLGVNTKLVDALGGKNRHAFDTLKQMTRCNFFEPLSKYLDVLVKHKNKVIDIELKPGNPFVRPWKGYAPMLGRAVGQLLMQNRYRHLLVRDQVVVSSFDSEKTQNVNNWGVNGVKDNVKARFKPIRTARAIYKTMKARFLDLVWRKNSMYNTVMLHYSMINPDLVAEYHAKGYSVGVYTLFDATETPDKGFKTRPSAQLQVLFKVIRSGVDWIETDNVVACYRGLKSAQDLYNIKAKSGKLGSYTWKTWVGHTMHRLFNRGTKLRSSKRAPPAVVPGGQG